MLTLFDLIAMHSSVRASVGLAFFLAALGFKWFLAQTKAPSRSPCAKLSQSC